ncbi:MAG TPA: hypothetical protein VJZ77_05915 [Blastocatellia bacterium]|nr:hypothetical protein [Blastocatellia bacterium]
MNLKNKKARKAVERRMAQKSRVKNIKLKPEMTRREIDRKIKQSARGYDLEGEPEVGDRVMGMEPEEFLEFVGREDVKITNLPASRRLQRKVAEIKIAQLVQANTKLAKRINRIRRMIEY